MDFRLSILNNARDCLIDTNLENLAQGNRDLTTP